MLINTEKDVPAEVKGWNWGAFLFTWIWGLFNNTWIALLALIPGVHFVMMFVLGNKGNEWAWQNKNWASVEQFHLAQRQWALYGVLGWGGLAVIFLLLPFTLISWKASTEIPEIRQIIDDFNPHRKFCNLALASAETDDRCYRTYGRPLQVRGQIYAAHDWRRGVSEMSIPVRGPRGEGVVYVRAQGNPASHDFRIERAEMANQQERFLLNTSRGNWQERADVRVAAAIPARNVFNAREPVGSDDAEELYREALSRIEQDEKVSRLLGNQITATVENATVNNHGPMGTAEFKVGLQGNGNAGMLDLKGMRSMGKWVFDGADLEIRTATGSETVQYPSMIPEAVPAR